MESPIILDGTTLEGGGQLLRIAVGLSALTATPIHIENIRGNRPKGGGLKKQHLSAVQWLAAASSADVEGAEEKSTELVLRPASPSERTASVPSTIDIGSAGSIALVFQAILPFILFGQQRQDASTNNQPPTSVNITIKGGTNVSNSPSYDYLSQVLLPTLSRIGLPTITATLDSRAWMDSGSDYGSVTFRIPPLAVGSHLPSFDVTARGEITHIDATVLAPRVCRGQAERELRANLAQQDLTVPINFVFEDSRRHTRLYVLLVAHTSHGHRLGRDLLYRRKVRPDHIAGAVSELVKEGARALARECKHGGCVDEYLRDQLVVFQALARGKSAVDGGRSTNGEILDGSLHKRTADWVVGKVLGVRLDEDGVGEGVGFIVGGCDAVVKAGGEVELVSVEVEEVFRGCGAAGVRLDLHRKNALPTQEEEELAKAVQQLEVKA